MYTPNGSAVEYVSYSCSHFNSNYHNVLDQNQVETYNVTLIASGDCRYNCHSYAWYNTSTNNTKWIRNPSLYMSDGSYYNLLNGLASFSFGVDSGAKVCYGPTTGALHSAVLTDEAANIPLAARTVSSKWGSCGIFSHAVSNVPDIYWDKSYTVSVWH